LAVVLLFFAYFTIPAFFPRPIAFGVPGAETTLPVASALALALSGLLVLAGIGLVGSLTVYVAFRRQAQGRSPAQAAWVPFVGGVVGWFWALATIYLPLSRSATAADGFGRWLLALAMFLVAGIVVLQRGARLLRVLRGAPVPVPAAGPVGPPAVACPLPPAAPGAPDGPGTPAPAGPSMAEDGGPPREAEGPGASGGQAAG
jgi:hypothetical protein